MDDIEVEAASQEEESTYFLLGAVDEPIGFDFDFIKIKTQLLSDTIFRAYSGDDLRKGRYFGSEGEHDAANKIKDIMENELGLYGPIPDSNNPYFEQIVNINSSFWRSVPGVNLTENTEINSFGLKINNESSNTSLVLTDNFHIRPTWNWRLFKSIKDLLPFDIFFNIMLKNILKFDLDDTDSYHYNMIFNNNWMTKNISGVNLKLVHRPTNFSWFSDVLDYYLDEICNNESIVGLASLLLYFLPKFQEYYNFTFGELTPENASIKFEWFDEQWNISDGEDFLFIGEDPAYNPNPPDTWTDYLIDILNKFPLLGKLGAYIISQMKQRFELILYNLSMPHCKGLIKYDFNNNTYNMQSSIFNSLPIIYINGSTGKPINASIEDYNISFWLDQTHNDNVESYNVIGQINGTDSEKTVIIDCLYDSWWNQGTADSAIGMAIVLGIAKYFNDTNITPKYNVKFIGFGGEEAGIRGAYYYEAKHPNENVVAVLDLNQLGFNQTGPISPNLNLIYNRGSNIIPIQNSILKKGLTKITDFTHYEDRMGYNTGLVLKRVNESPIPSDYMPYYYDRRLETTTICFLKDLNWTLHHRSGENHTQGDTMTYYNHSDVNLTTELIWNITKYYCCNPDSWFDEDPTSLIWDADEDGDDDAANVTFSISTSFPHDQILVKPVLIHQIKFLGEWYNDPNINNRSCTPHRYIITPNSDVDDELTVKVPSTAVVGKYRLKIYLFNSTGDVNNYVFNPENTDLDLFNILFANESRDLGIFDMEPFDNEEPVGSYYVSSAQGSTAVAGNRNTYITGTTDPDNNQVYYQFEYGNTQQGYEYTPWFGPYTSGENCTFDLIWTSVGNMTVRARARDDWFAPQTWTNWTNSLNQTINPGCRIFDYPSVMLVNKSYPLQGVVYGFSANNWSWDWGDGQGAANFTFNASNKFDETGNFTINLTTRDSQSNNYSTEINIQVLPLISNYQITDESKQLFETVIFNDLSIGENTINNWTWNFGDGNISYSQNTSHNYSNDGIYNVTLTVKDNQNYNHTSYQMVYIDSVDPATICSFYTPNPTTDENLPPFYYFGPVGRGNNVTLYANLYDNISGINSIKINITNPNGSSNEFTMNSDTDNPYDYMYTFNDTLNIGNYNYTIYAVDKANNTDYSRMYWFTVDHLFGYTQDSVLCQNISDRISGNVFTVNANGTADNITAFIQTNLTVAPKIKCMIYRANDSSLVGTSEELTYNTGSNPEWVKFNFSSPKPQLYENTQYILTCWSNNTCNLYYDNISSNIGRYKNETYGTSPDPINWTANETRFYSICCFYKTTPEITSVAETPETIGLGGNITINATIKDFGCSSTPYVNISYPDYSTGNFSMSHVRNNNYKYIFSDTWLVGQYNYTIWEVDGLGGINNSSGHSFNVSSQATISVCTIKDSYGDNETVNLTDPPGEPPIIGYELLDDDQVLHVWNDYNSYYLDTDNGIQLTNHKDEYWTQNVLMLGYYNNDIWNLIYRTDELISFTKNITTDNETFVNATLWKDLSFGGYDFRLAIRYYLGVDDVDLTVIPYIKNIDSEDIPYVLGFGWEMKDLQIADVTIDNYLRIYNGSGFEDILLNQTIDNSYTNMGNHTIIRLICTNPPTFHRSRNLYLSWNKNLTYKVSVKSRTGQDNAPVTLFIRIGYLNSGQVKTTMMHWLDSDDWLGISSNEYDSHCGDTGGHTLEEALDGTDDYWYHNKLTGHDHYFVLDLGQSYTVKKFRGRSIRGSDPIDVDVFVSDNESDWGSAVVTGISSWQDTNSWQETTLSEYKQGRYIKVEVQDTEHFLDYIEWGGSMGPPYMSIFDVYAGIEPLAINPYPANGSSGICIAPRLNITVSDVEGDSMNITWYIKINDSWQVLGTNNSVNNGTYHQVYSNASVNGQWWEWYVNVTDISGNSFISDTFKFYTGNQSKIKNTGSYDISGYLLIQVQYYNTTTSNWTVADETINETTIRTISSGEQLGLDTIFNGNLSTTDLLNTFGNGTYRVYAAFRDPDGDVLVCDDESLLEASYEFSITSS